MSHPAHIKATHKAIQSYYQTLQAYQEHGVGHETAVDEMLVQHLLTERLFPKKTSLDHNGVYG